MKPDTARRPRIMPPVHRVAVTIGLLCIAGLTAAPAPAATPAPVALSGKTMGTTWSVKLAQRPADLDEAALAAEIDGLLEMVNDQMSTYRSRSELSRFNAGRDTGWFDVSAATAAVVERALEIGRRSRGAFDITVGPLVELWGFGARSGHRRVPEAHELERVRSLVGFERLAVRRDPPALRKEAPGLEVDLSAIAKGDAVDRVGALLDGRGHSNWLVEIGGETRARGRKADGGYWGVAIERPLAGVRVIDRVVPLFDAALATSGDYRNFYVEDGVRYSHIFDPRAGAPVGHRLASVSVLADNCRDADAWATALLVLGEQEGFEVALEQDLAALFLVRAGESLRELATPGFVARVSPGR